MTIVENTVRPVVVGGVDTHGEFHVAAAVDANGGVLGVETFDAGTGGYRALVRWLAGFGDIDLVGIEGTGSYGAGLARHLGNDADWTAYGGPSKGRTIGSWSER